MFVCSSSLEWRQAPLDYTYVSKLVAQVEEFMNGVTNPEKVWALFAMPSGITLVICVL